MESRVKAGSVLLLFALVLSLVPAAMLPARVSAAAVCDWAQFVADVTVPDGTKFDPGATFTKTWRLRNIGTCTWTKSYLLVFDSGEKMGAPDSVPFPTDVPPGQSIDLTVNMTAPSTAGHYFGYWKLKNASGVLFGIGFNANRTFWVEINVTGTAPANVVYDFTANAGSATWSSSAGGLPSPGPDGDPRGFWLTGSDWKYEDGTSPGSSILVAPPQNITNGYIQGVYPDFKVQKGDVFKTQVGCELQATSCYVQFSLAYQIGSGPAITIWRFNEKWDRRTRPRDFTYPDIGLDALAGKDVKLILYMSAYGSPVGDRAIWGNPVIVRKGAPPPPTVTGTPPTSTPTKTPGPVTVTVPPSSCDKAQFIADVTVPDGTVFAPGATFKKTWRLKNVGSCAWSTSYQMVFTGGEPMGAPSSAAFPQNVAVGQTVDISVNMTAPSTAGSYRGYWMFKNANGALFGIGAQANKPWWVDIRVSGPTVTPGGPTKTPTPTVTPGGPTFTPTPTQPSAGTVYDFAANASSATWSSGAGNLPFPGTDGDSRGYAITGLSWKYEDGTTPQSAILVAPQNITNGYIKGTYPAFKVQAGDIFKTRLGCEGVQKTSCYVEFRLYYQIGSGAVLPIPFFPTGREPFYEKWDGSTRPADSAYPDIKLDKLAGQDVKFILYMSAYGSPAGDRALWGNPVIVRKGVSTPTTSTPSPTPTPTGTAGPSATPTATSTTSASAYQNTKYGFKFTLPSGATIVNQSDSAGYVSLPIITPGTNLLEKYIQIHVVEGANPCVSPEMDNPTSSENVTINSIQFLKQTGRGAAAGNRYDWTAYSTTRNNACISLAFILHSANPGNYPTPPPEFDLAAESAVIGTTMSTFNWIT